MGGYKKKEKKIFILSRLKILNFLEKNKVSLILNIVSHAS